jgi:hypothetical protein
VATERDIEVIEDNDPIIVFVCKVDGTPVDLTGATIDFYLKPDKTTEETDATVVRYSTDTGEVTIPSQTGDTVGQCLVQLDRADLGTPGKLRYRFDVTQGGKVLTYAYGRVIVIDV